MGLAVNRDVRAGASGCGLRVVVAPVGVRGCPVLSRCSSPGRARRRGVVSKWALTAALFALGVMSVGCMVSAR
jgi:hypothetical protein